MRILTCNYDHADYKKVHIITNSFFDPGNTGAMTDQAKFETALDKLPAEGYLCLDTEGVWFDPILKGRNSPLFQQTVQNHLDLLAVAKAKRPTMLIGFYSIPLTIRHYDGGLDWPQDEEWAKDVAALEPLLTESGVLFPSAYDRDNFDDHKDRQRINGVVRMAMQMHQRVMPFVWHRWAPNVAVDGFKSIPEDEFKTHVQAAIDTRFYGREVDALVHWSADEWHFNHSRTLTTGNWPRIKAVIDEERLDNETPAAFAERNQNRTLQYLEDII